MEVRQYTRAREVLFKVLETQPNLFGPRQPSAHEGKQLAETIWAFMEEFSKNFEQKVKGSPE
ncbi:MULTISPECIES: hypothetical protein [Achromobacter]|jgi:hypothetical protein|uniref:hypothetical protein n=1 Tax=Achromobacter TaxID=222 RepID=UPI0019107B2D|nr:hypothetical protein [Achromobacter xylosoxidans]QQE57583.1 hypothetical protein I6H41_00585 [Achromobacter xylosoxidans]QQV17222.1 hypothetical protein I6I48_15720 [Achromobacter xylosoxidans]UXL07170.1 hypothetical protein N4T34_10850 [Achromobacter xylosoxidans]